MKVTIVGKNGCSMCEQAVYLCQSHGLATEYQILDSDITKEKLFEMCGGPVRSVPQVFITANGFTEYVGGYAELQRRLMKGFES